MPTPHKSENKSDYLKRCLSDEETKSKYPNIKQRYAVCNSMYDEHKKKSTAEWIEESLKNDKEIS